MIRAKVILLILVLSVSFAQVTSEHLYYGASSLGMAGSDVACQGGAWAIFNNPAGLAGQERNSVVLGSESLYGLSYFKHTLAGFQIGLPFVGTIGISVEDFSTDYKSRSLAHETATGFYQGITLQADRNSTLFFGYGIRLQMVDYGQSAGPSGDGSDGRDLGSHQAVGLDAGLLASLQERIRFGAKVTNINHPQLGEANAAVDLPRRIQIGMAYSPYNLVWTTAALSRSMEYPTQIHAGMDYEILPSLHLRAGVQSNPNRFGAGFSLKWEILHIDYGFLTHPVLPLTQQLSLEIQWL